MRITGATAWITGICLAATALPQSPPQEPVTKLFSLHLYGVWYGTSTDIAATKIGSPVEFRIKWTNTSNHDLNASVMYGPGGLIAAFTFDVRDAAGNPVPKLNRKLHGGASVSIRPHILKPGESVEYGDTLNRGYDINTPGEYSIRACRHVDPQDADPSAPDGSEICSSWLTLKVFPASAGGRK